MVYPSDIAFTESVKAIQERKQSREAYARLERDNGWPTELTPDLSHFVAAQTSFFLGTANHAGQPYIQHRGGPPGFLHVIDSRTLAFADFKGNRQYITQGNLAENPKAFLFLIDYESRVRIKIWGSAEVLEDQPELLKRLMPGQGTYKARGEQVILFNVEAWDRNCQQHIPRKIDWEHVEALMAERDRRIEALEAQVRLYERE